MSARSLKALLLLFLCVSALAQNIPCGDLLSEGVLNGIAARSNGHQMRTQESCEKKGEFGLHYQCVEFIKRYYSQALQVDTHEWKGNAAQYFDADNIRQTGLVANANGSTVEPQPNDILVFASPTDAETRNGHVAIISAVAETFVEVVEQNWSPTGRARLALVRKSNGGFLIKDRSQYKVLGWLRLPSQSTPRLYTVTDIGALPGAVVTTPGSINNRGEVVGAAIIPSDPNPVHGFSWTPIAGILDLFPPVFAASVINNNDEIVGEGFFNGRDSPFTLLNGVFTDVGALTPGITLSAINNLGVGIGQTGDLKAIIYNNGQVTPLNVCTGACISTPFEINDLGDVVGTFNEAGGAAPFYYENGAVFSFGIPAGTNAFAFALNNKSEVVGGIAGNGGHAFLWTKISGLTDLDALFGFDFSEAHAINNNTEVVGTSSGRAFVWTKAFGILDLNQQLVENPGWILESATAINDLGQIAGTGELDGQPHAFLLTPTTQ